MKTRHFRVLAAAMAVSLLLTGCGGRAENVWIGGYRESGSKWKWVKPVFPSLLREEYGEWDANQPDNYGGNEDYLRYANVSKDYGTWSCVAGKWNDTANEGDADAPISSFGYICEWQLIDGWNPISLEFWSV